MASLLTSTAAGSTIYHSGITNQIVNRGNPGSGNSANLYDFGVTHYYYADGVSSIDISSNILEDAVYELDYTTTTSGTNIDIIIYPNYTTYGSQFTAFYWGSPGFYVFNQTLSYFYFDHYGGGNGSNPSGKFILYNTRNIKYAHYRGGDTDSTCMGTGRWNNNSTIWSAIGTLVGLQGGNVRAYVKRIA
jgi:hypothetical protein